MSLPYIDEGYETTAVHDVAAGAVIAPDDAVGLNSAGYAGPLDAATYNRFAGFNGPRRVDNTAGSAGAKTVEIKTLGRIDLAVTGAAPLDAGPLVYGVTRGRFTKTAKATAATTHRARSGNVATLKTAAAHGLAAGQDVTVAGISGYNGTVKVLSVPTTTSFTYANTGSDEAETADTNGVITALGVLIGRIVRASLAGRHEVQYAGVGMFFRPRLDGALAALVNQTAGAASDGTVGAVPDADLPADAAALRTDLNTNILPAVRNALTELVDRCNQLTALLNA